MQTTLVLIDIQQDYFEGGKHPLEGSLEASQKAARLLEQFRKKMLPVIHIRHIALEPDAGFFQENTPGAEFHSNVTPLDSEIVVEKHSPNSFLNTNLAEILRNIPAESLVLAGMMTHMCVDATVRAASDFGFECVVAEDACATRALIFENDEVPARQVHFAFLAALRDGYAQVMKTEQVIGSLC